MAYNLMKRVITRAKKNGTLDAEKPGIQEKLDAFLAASRITTEEYRELTQMMQNA